MPIDPNFIHALTIPNPIQSQYQAATLRDMMLTAAMKQQEIQNQRFQFQLAQEQAARDAQARQNVAANMAALSAGPQAVDPTQFGGAAAPPTDYVDASGRPTLRTPDTVVPPSPAVPSGPVSAGTNAPAQIPEAVPPQRQMTLLDLIQSQAANAPAPAVRDQTFQPTGYTDLPAFANAPTVPSAVPPAATPANAQPDAASSTPIVPASATVPPPIPVGAKGKPLVTPGPGQIQPHDAMFAAAFGQLQAGNLKEAMDLFNKGQEVATKYAEAGRYTSEAKKNDLESAEKQNSYIAQSIGSLRSAPPEDKPALYDQVKADLVSKGYVKAQDLPPTLPDDNFLAAQEQTHLTAGQWLDKLKGISEINARNADQQRAAGMYPQQVREQMAKANAATMATVGGQLAQAQNQDQWTAALSQIADPQVRAQFGETFSPQAAARAQQLGLTADQQVTTAQTAQRDRQVATNEAVRNEIARGELGVSAGRLNIEKQRFGYDTGTGVSPAAEAIVAGKMDPQGVRMMMRSNPGIIGQVLKIDPGFDEANMDKRYQVLKEFSDSNATKAGGQVLALNTMLHHADLFQQVGAALQNGSFKPGNALYNRVTSELGSAPPQDARLVAQFLAGEVGKLSKGGVATDGEIKQIMKELGDNGSPEQIEHAGDRLVQIAAGRAIPLAEKVQDARLGNVVKVIGPSAREILQRRGYDPDTLKKRNAQTPTANPFAPANPPEKNPFR